MPTIYTANDGVYYNFHSAGSYLAARDAAVASAGHNNAVGWYYHYLSAYINMRTFHAFDTSGISFAPSSATISFYGNAFGGAFSSRLVKSTAPVDLVTGMTTASYNDIVGFSAGSSMAGNVTDYSDTVTNWVNYTWMVYTLNATALADIASQNVFSVCNANYEWDYLNVACTVPQMPHGNFAGAPAAHGLDPRPKLDYVEGAAGYSHDVLGVDSGDIGKIVGVATADTSKVCGRAA